MRHSAPTLTPLILPVLSHSLIVLSFTPKISAACSGVSNLSIMHHPLCQYNNIDIYKCQALYPKVALLKIVVDRPPDDHAHTAIKFFA